MIFVIYEFLILRIVFVLSTQIGVIYFGKRLFVVFAISWFLISIGNETFV